MYELNAIIGAVDLLRTRAVGFEQAVVVELRQGLGLVPVTAELLREWGSGVDGVLAEWSRSGPIALVEADFFGGEGSQSAVVWRDGEVDWGPVFAEEFRGPWREWPINAALDRLGAVSGGGDLFDAVGLGAERDVADWVARGRQSPTNQR
ncbi:MULTISPECIES: hypothetical protein [unclassified Crossiella]|uniref:hypothetical protein n=1 Tax=unclassified Crossiella TaxID=2620835 RepID=UPI001FFFF1D5|nr:MULTISPECIES: hypothetical protein [unclassified Crossiella]MCK2242474.1 hypothetical protein [Crossiella sp. S99.2]MCK2254496.1 hypothetical protein [Crossiella sp. S99.1]